MSNLRVVWFLWIVCLFFLRILISDYFCIQQMNGYYTRNGKLHYAVGNKSLYIIQANLGL